MDQLDHKDQQDHQEAMANKETKEPPDQPVITASQDQLEQLDHQDLQDHQETSATYCLEISGTPLMETKELLCTEANEPLMRR